MKHIHDQNYVIRWLRDLLCGLLIGAGAILPGVSGGVLAVIFGIYRPFMELLNHPKQSIPKYLPWFPPIIIGWVAGFLGFAKGIAAALHLSGTVTIWLFIGLIVGTIPSLFREAGREGRTPSAWISFCLFACSVFAGLFYISHVAGIRLEPNFWTYNLCGVLWGMGIVIPGMTSSSVMMALGLYEPMMEGLANLEFLVLAASLPGMFLTMALLARLVNWFFRRHYSVAFHGILGIVVATTLVIIPNSYANIWEILLSGLCCIGGFLLAFGMARLDRRVEKGNKEV